MSRDFSTRLRVWLVALSMCGLSAGFGLAADVDITAPIDLDTQSGTTAEVAPGVTFAAPFPGRAVNATTSAWALTNRGSISGSGLATVELRAAGSSVVNYNSITSPDSNAIWLFNGGTVDNKTGATITGNSAILIGHSSTAAGSGGVAGGAATVTNSGTISSARGAVILNFGGTLTNQLGGIISTTGNGDSAITILRGTSRLVSNSGTVTSTGTGFAAGVTVQAGDSTVINTSSGSIAGTYNGIYAGSDAVLNLTNDGTISSTGSSTNHRAVEASAGGTIVNTGTIQSAAGTGIWLGNAGTITNSGTVSGPLHAIQFANTNAVRTLQLDTGSVLTGNVLGSTGTLADNLVLLGNGSEDLGKFLNFETLSMQGTAWSLTGAGAFSTSAEVQTGLLTVGGDLTSPAFSILAGGTLTGTGTIIGTVSNSGRVEVAAGETLHITGTLTQTGTSSFAVGVTPLTAGVLAVTGAADLGSSTLRVLAGTGTFAPASSYTILTAASVTGSFGSLTSSSPFLTPSVVYNPTSVVLTLDRSLVSFASAGRTRNQTATGAALDTLDDTDPLVAPLAVLDLDDAAAAFDQLSGEAYASTQAALAGETHLTRQTALDRVDAAFAALDEMKAGRQTIWAQGIGDFTTISGDGNAAAVGGGSAGLLIGMDGLLNDAIPVSVFGGFSAARFAIPDRYSDMAMQTAHFGVSAGRAFGNFRVKGGVTGGLAGIHVDRDIDMAGLTDSTSADYLEGIGQSFAELSYVIPTDRVTLEPFGRLALIGVSGGSYRESGGDAALSGHSDAYGAAVASLGLGGSSSFALADGVDVDAHGRIGLQQTFGGAPTAVNRFGAGDSFTVAGTPLGGTALLLDAGIAADLSPTAHLAVDYSGRVGTAGQSYGVKATLSGRF